MESEKDVLKKGIRLFNEKRYFEAHEEWEHAWRAMGEGDEKKFFQGLIMAAASLYHYVRRECRGAVVMLDRCVALLERGVDRHREIRIAEFIESLGDLRKNVVGECAFVLPPDKLPTIRREGLLLDSGQNAREEDYYG
jgi:predicted metal-dependent hydrolase